MEMIKAYFQAMQSMNCGKAASLFFEKAEELNNIVLTNKTYQTTRFARALQRANTAAIRNLPTIVPVIAVEYNKAALEHSNTRALELKSLIKCLTSAERLFFSINS